MITTIHYESKKIQIDLSKPLDISIAIGSPNQQVLAWYTKNPKIEPVKNNDWVGSVEQGACVNFNNIFFNPHAHGTHTECVGHITKQAVSINACLKQFFFITELITVAPETLGDDLVISKKQLQLALGNKKRDSVVIRTLPNTNQKYGAQYYKTNPPYLLEEAAIYLKEKGVKHLLIDLPSVDKEEDHCKLLAHRAFWNVSGVVRTDATITELVFVPNTINDGCYLLNLQIAPFENDATPSKPVLYKIEN